MKAGERGRDQVRLTIWIWLCALGGAVCFAPLTDSNSYLTAGAFTAGFCCLIGLTLRLTHVPGAVIVLVQLAVLFWWATLVYAGDSATGGLLPNRATGQEFQRLFEEALDHLSHYRSPVPYNESLQIILGMMVGLLAIVIDFISGSLRRTPIVGLVFLAIYMAPVSLLSGDVSMWIFLPGAISFVFLLAAEERAVVTAWGRNIANATSGAVTRENDIETSGLNQASLRAGFGAVALAVVLPIMIPTLSANYFGDGGAGGGGGDGGDGTVDVGNPAIDMRRNLSGQSKRELLWMTSDGEPPRYVRLSALDHLDEDGWSPTDRGPEATPIDSTLPAAVETSNGLDSEFVDYGVRVSKAFESDWLPTIYSPNSISLADGDNWQIDARHFDVVSTDEDTNAAGLEYDLSSTLFRPSAEQLRQSPGNAPSRELQEMIDVPGVFEDSDSFASGLEEATRGRRTAFDKAMGLQEWFRETGGFTYSLTQTSGNSEDTMEEFVGGDKTGYCEQFASAMAIMARQLGIPARIAVGFLSGRQDGDEYVFTGQDMHAWPELYFDGVGWVQFEPTPADRQGSEAAEFGGSDIPEPEPTDLPSGTADNPDMGNASPEATPSDSQTSAAPTSSGSDDSWSWRPLAFSALIVLAAVLLLLAPRFARATRTKRRWRLADDPRTHAEAAWAELRDRARDLRMPWNARKTPRGTGRLVRQQLAEDPTAVAALNRIVVAVERARYSADADETDLRPDVAVVSTALGERVSGKTRWLATWVPMSVFGIHLIHRDHRAEGNVPGGDHEELIALRE